MGRHSMENPMDSQPDFPRPEASIAPPGGPIDPGVPGAPDAPSSPDGPTFPEGPSFPDAPSYPGTPDITPGEPDPIPEDSTFGDSTFEDSALGDSADTPAHYGHWFAADEQAS